MSKVLLLSNPILQVSNFDVSKARCKMFLFIFIRMICFTLCHLVIFVCVPFQFGSASVVVYFNCHGSFAFCLP